MRGHAVDPQWRPDVIRLDTGEHMRWDRWSGWERGDPRWRVSVLDTSKLTVADVANEVVAWIEGERALLDRGG